MLGPIIGPASALLPKAHKPQLRLSSTTSRTSTCLERQGHLDLNSKVPDSPAAYLTSIPGCRVSIPSYVNLFPRPDQHGKKPKGRVMADGVHFRSLLMARDISWVAWLVPWRSSCLTARRLSLSDAKLSTSPANFSVQNVRCTYIDRTYEGRLLVIGRYWQRTSLK